MVSAAACMCTHAREAPPLIHIGPAASRGSGKKLAGAGVVRHALRCRRAKAAQAGMYRRDPSGRTGMHADGVRAITVGVRMVEKRCP